MLQTHTACGCHLDTPGPTLGSVLGRTPSAGCHQHRHTHNLRVSPRYKGTHMLTVCRVSPRHPQPPRCHIHKFTACGVSLRQPHRLTIAGRHFRPRSEPHADPTTPPSQPSPQPPLPPSAGVPDTQTQTRTAGRRDRWGHRQTRTARVTDLGGRGSHGSRSPVCRLPLLTVTSLNSL